ncbi:MAG TPA: C45 family autoproteolytic acyltransferase/hydrolase [Candidatus Hydrogenedentes bacterium]|nr:C45 family autoproteolytic acyltransferase/hydrolase [Candidatus Hydrogenedentota bacterium]HPG68407.1 C45 family autoproteolytic acyltransferase/hydrolase [Candidatus Hydrogenedentota bacterium]
MKRRKQALLVLTALSCFIGRDAAAAGYRTSVGSGDDAIPLVVLTGSAYEMGYALGHLMKEEITAFAMRLAVGAKLLNSERYSEANLDGAWDATLPYTHPRFVDELRGVADGAGVSFDLLRRAHMIPVISAYSCSGGAFWGEATRGDVLYQFRNLDYTMSAGFQDFPLVAVYLPQEGIAHVNVTFSAFIGTNAGMNASGIALTEMGDSPEHEYPFDVRGVPFTVLFRDLLYDAHNLDEAIEIVKAAKRIKKYHYIIGDGANRRAVKMLAHAPDLVIWTDNDPADEVAPNVRPGLVYNCEGRDPIGWAHIGKYYGRYNLEAVIQLSQGVASIDGNLLDVVYDATNLECWIAYAHQREGAHQRAFVQVNMKDYLDFTKRPADAVVFEKE